MQPRASTSRRNLSRFPPLRACRGRARASAGRWGEAEALRHVRGVWAVQPLPDLHVRGGSKWSCASGSRSPGAGSSPARSDSQCSPERHVSLQPAQPSGVFFWQATVTQGPLGMGSVIAAGYMALKSKYKIQLTGSGCSPPRPARGCWLERRAGRCSSAHP